MNKITKSFVSLWAVYFLATGLALAEPADVMIIDGQCVVLNEDGDTVSSEFTEGQAVISSSNANGNVTFTCSFKQDRPTAGRSVIFNYDSFLTECGSPWGQTKDWHQVISASGNTKLSCHYKD